MNPVTLQATNWGAQIQSWHTLLDSTQPLSRTLLRIYRYLSSVDRTEKDYFLWLEGVSRLSFLVIHLKLMKLS
jgi:hypothetical protein